MVTYSYIALKTDRNENKWTFVIIPNTNTVSIKHLIIDHDYWDR